MVGTITGMSQRQFQSTPPARGATAGNCLSGSGNHISIHAPREGGDTTMRLIDADKLISIHAPREGGDLRHSPPLMRTA